VFDTEGSDDPPGLAQLVAGHVWEEVVLYLVVQTAEPEVGEAAGLYVLRGEDLLVEEVQPVAVFQDRQSLVIGGEGGDQEKAE
jgi:hypothetical protein